MTVIHNSPPWEKDFDEKFNHPLFEVEWPKGKDRTEDIKSFIRDLVEKAERSCQEALRQMNEAYNAERENIRQEERLLCKQRILGIVEKMRLQANETETDYWFPQLAEAIKRQINELER